MKAFDRFKKWLEAMKKDIASKYKAVKAQLIANAANKIRLFILIGVAAFVIILFYILQPSEPDQPDTGISITSTVLGLIVIVAIITFFAYKIRKRFPKKAKPAASTAAAPAKKKDSKPPKDFGYWFWRGVAAMIAVALVITWWHGMKVDHEGTKPIIFTKVVVTGKIDSGISYGLHYFEKGIWYKCPVSDKPLCYIVHKDNNTIIEPKFIDGVEYVRAVNQSDSVSVNKDPLPTN